MNRKYTRVMALAIVFGLVSVATGRLAAASSAAWEFTMKLRAVDGERNKTFHALDGGVLTLSGSIWVTSKLARATDEPQPIRISVQKRGLFNSEVCTLSLTPERTFNKKNSFSMSCGSVVDGTYFLFLSKRKSIDDTGDGWHIQGSGTLVTH